MGIGVSKKIEINEITKQGNQYFRNKHVRSARVVLAHSGCAGCILARHAVVPARATAPDTGTRTGRFRNHLTPCFQVNSSDHVASHWIVR